MAVNRCIARAGLHTNEQLIVAAVANTPRNFSVLKRPHPKYASHVPLTGLERAGLAVGSAVVSFFNPYRAGMFIVQ